MINTSLHRLDSASAHLSPGDPYVVWLTLLDAESNSMIVFLDSAEACDQIILAADAAKRMLAEHALAVGP